jgi:hypothetical protein
MTPNPNTGIAPAYSRHPLGRGFIAVCKVLIGPSFEVMYRKDMEIGQDIKMPGESQLTQVPFFDVIA